jgi:hypothetical protein
MNNFADKKGWGKGDLVGQKELDVMKLPVHRDISGISVLIRKERDTKGRETSQGLQSPLDTEP